MAGNFNSQGLPLRSRIPAAMLAHDPVRLMELRVQELALMTKAEKIREKQRDHVKAVEDLSEAVNEESIRTGGTLLALVGMVAEVIVYFPQELPQLEAVIFGVRDRFLIIAAEFTYRINNLYDKIEEENGEIAKILKQLEDLETTVIMEYYLSIYAKAAEKKGLTLKEYMGKKDDPGDGGNGTGVV